MPGLGFLVEGLGFRVLGFWVWGLGSGFKVRFRGFEGLWDSGSRG